MTKTVDYFLAPQSPWTYLGHARFAAMTQAAGYIVHVRPMDLGKIFPVSGGLPLPKRAPQRQAYRLVELARFRDHLQMPLNLHPSAFLLQATQLRGSSSLRVNPREMRPPWHSQAQY